MYCKQRGGGYKLPESRILGIRRLLPPAGCARTGRGGAPLLPSTSGRSVIGNGVFLLFHLPPPPFFFSLFLSPKVSEFRCMRCADAILSAPWENPAVRQRNKRVGLGIIFFFFFSIFLFCFFSLSLPPQICRECLCNNRFAPSTPRSAQTGRGDH